MKRESARLRANLTLLSLLLSPVLAIDCSKLVADDHKFDLSALKGPHSVVTSEHTPPTFTNTTYTLDICGVLKRSSDVAKGDECPNGSFVCAIERSIRDDDPTKDNINHVIPIAGNLVDYGGKELADETTRLRPSDSNADSQKEGLRLVLKGGAYPLDAKPGEKREQRAIIEFICDPDKEGKEGEWDPEDKYLSGDSETDKGTSKREDKKEGEEGGDGKPAPHTDGKQQLKKEGAALIWNSYGPLDDEKNIDVLRLTWYTKYACEKRDGGSGNGDSGAKGGWGFFTWLIIVAFLGIASYLIFGSWLNYNRYGARGWDLLPHGDTLRDIPYLLKDWTRRLLNTVQGSGSRGGYSAI